MPRKASTKNVKTQENKEKAKNGSKNVSANAQSHRFKNPVAVILIRGFVKMPNEIKHTLKLLGLKKKFNCVITENTPDVQGMLKKVKDYVTWGEVKQEMIDALLKKRKNLSKKSNKLIFALHPPVGGFEKGGIKKHFTQGGVLGYRGDGINDLLDRMSKLF